MPPSFSKWFLLDDKLCGDLNQGLTGSLTSHRPSGVARTPLRTSVPLLRMVLYQQCHSHAFSPSKPHFLDQRPTLRQPSSTMHLSRSLLSLGHLYILLLNFSPIFISLFKHGIALYVLLIISWARLISPVREWQCEEEGSA